MPLMADSKVCSGCKLDLHTSKFSNSHSRCNVCRGHMNKRKFASLSESEQEDRRILRNKRALGYKKPTPAQMRRHALSAKYGITPECFNSLLASQNGGCRLCGGIEAGGRHNVFHVDHCHSTGRVRGLLCHKCNLALGILGDSYGALKRALEYVTEANFPNIKQTKLSKCGDD